MYIVEDTEAGMTLAMKMAGEHQDNSIIPLTPEEMEVLNRGGFQTLSNDQGPFIKLDRNSTYVFMADQHVNLEDVLAVSKHLGIEIGIIRIDR